MITSDQDIVAVGRPHLGSEITTYNGFLQGSKQVSAPMLFKNQWGYDSALYIQNVGSGDASVTIDFYDATTGDLTCTKTDRITPLASKGYWLPDLSCTPTPGMPSSWYGSAVITSDQDIVAVGRPHLGSEITTYDGFLMQGSMQGNSISGRVTNSQGTRIPDVSVEVYVGCDAWSIVEPVSYAYTDA